MGPDGLPSLLLASRRDAAGSNGGSDGSSKGAQGPLLSSLWLEANPLSEQAVLQLLELAEGAAAAASSSGSNGSSGGKRGKQPRIGLDDRQLSGRVLEEWQQQQRGCSVVRRGIVKVGCVGGLLLVLLLRLFLSGMLYQQTGLHIWQTCHEHSSPVAWVLTHNTGSKVARTSSAFYRCCHSLHQGQLYLPNISRER